MEKNLVRATAENVVKINPISCEEKQKIKGAAYVRVSSSSEEQIHSYTQQISHYARFFREREDELELVEIYADEGITGTSTKRDQFQRMLTDARLGKIQRIYTKSISRFARDKAVVLATIRELSALGVSVCFEDDGIDTATMPSEFSLCIQSMSAEEVSKTISRNCRNGFVMRVQDGNYHQSESPYGYNIVDGELVVCEEEAGIVQGIFADYLSGVGASTIAKRLNQKSVASPKKKTTSKGLWYTSSVVSILKNERVIGDCLYQKKYTTDTLPYKTKRNYGEKDQFYIAGTHEGIISQEDFHKVSVMMEKRSEQFKTNQQSRTPHPFSGKFFCGQCGCSMQKKVSNGTVYWVCNNKRLGNTKCDILPMAESELVKSFSQLNNKLVENKEKILGVMIGMLTELRVAKNQSDEKIQEITFEIHSLAEESHMLNNLSAKGVIDKATCIASQTEINGKLVKLRKSKEQIITSQENDNMLMETKMLNNFMEERTSWKELNKLIFNKIIVKMETVDSSTVQYTLTNGLEFVEKICRGNGVK